VVVDQLSATWFFERTPPAGVTAIRLGIVTLQGGPALGAEMYAEIAASVYSVTFVVWLKHEVPPGYAGQPKLPGGTDLVSPSGSVALVLFLLGER